MTAASTFLMLGAIALGFASASSQDGAALIFALLLGFLSLLMRDIREDY